MTQPTAGKIAGVVLAGGQSRRFEGEDKAFASLHGKPLIEHALNSLQNTYAKAISANHALDAFKAFGVPVLQDMAPDLGPLGGVLAGLQWANDQHADWLLTVPVDTPFLPHNLPELLLAQSQAADIVSARTHQSESPICAVWRTALAGDLKHFLIAEKARKVTEFLVRHRWKTALLAEGPHDPLFNINTKDALQQANRLELSK